MLAGAGRPRAMQGTGAEAAGRALTAGREGEGWGISSDQDETSSGLRGQAEGEAEAEAFDCGQGNDLVCMLTQAGGTGLQEASQ